MNHASEVTRLPDGEGQLADAVVSSRRLLASVRDVSATVAVQAVAAGEMAVTALATAALERAREVDGEIGAFRHLDEALVLAQARRLDLGPRRPLTGLLIAVKDAIDTADSPTGYGSALFEDHQPSNDADVVGRLRNQGALIFGKTASTEFAMFEPTTTLNPTDPHRTPGGSSSGSAAAVAAGVVPVAIGTQTAGSVIRPAAYCGVWGLKPAIGWTSVRGVLVLAESLDTIGLFARSVGDLRIAYEGLRSGSAPQRQRRPVRRTVGVLPGTEWGTVSPEVIRGLENVGGRLARNGFDLISIEMDETWLNLPMHHETIMAFEVSKNLRRLLGSRVSIISASSRRIIEHGDGVSEADYLASLEARNEAAEALAGWTRSVDLILTSSALGVAPLGLHHTGDPVMCRPWSLLGVPAANIPFICNTDRLPIGLQAVSPDHDDVAFLDDLAAIELALTSDGQVQVSA